MIRSVLASGVPSGRPRAGRVCVVLARFIDLLSQLACTKFAPSELARAQSLRHEDDRRRLLARRLLAHQAVALSSGCRADAVEVWHEPSGRPRAGIAGLSSGCALSLSSSGAWAAAAAAMDRLIGVDIQWVDQDPPEPGLLRRVLRGPELQALGNRPAEHLPAAWIALWTRKEACLKALGWGLTVEPRKVVLPPLAPRWEGLAQPLTLPDGRQGSIVSWRIDTDHVVSACTAGAAGRVQPTVFGESTSVAE
jgi:phosphopantetheinyl transferase